ncbi:Rieske 2Fe-2S domain-containing protein [Blastococcus sp. KM273129]|uniref:Rieske 2Fe-2S domain-containing protein n=1 Tax=Blastococcus sp. KM273129 TaxID=2570315 RepID=UPI001F338885|nr:Rieske 2Fe-2S domain-containing protein [Blastococcus sp. KM273129]MCF6736050.1 (2Fe-2S)-binding protein [Blastococcus sp. KM273129]
MVAISALPSGWFAVARAADVGTTPVPVGAGGRAWVVVRLRPGGEVSAFPAGCPHRAVPLASATVTDGRLECPRHGWRFDADGRCVAAPSLGPAGAPPPRADLAMPWAVEERHGWVWLAPDRTVLPLPPRPAERPVPEAPPPVAAPRGPVFGNLDPSLDRAWHPVALSPELRDGGWLQVRLLGRTWTLRRDGDGLRADPPAHGVRERWGVVELAPAAPAGAPLEVPEDDDRRFLSRWLAPRRTPAPAAVVADLLLDVARLPFVHGGTTGAADHPEVPPYEVVREAGGFRSVQEQWCDDPLDPEVALGGRPLRQRRRVTYVHRAPFALRVRRDQLDSGATTTVVTLLQPEDADSTRVLTRVLHASGPGRPLPSRALLAAHAAAEQQALDADLALLAGPPSAGLPLDPRVELHLPADRLGVALRDALCDFRAAGRTRAAA